MLRHAAPLALLPCLPLQAQEATPKSLTLEQASGRGEAPGYGRSAPRVTFAPTGEHVLVGSGDEVKWIHLETLAEVEPVEPEAAESPAEDAEDAASSSREDVAAALATLDGVDEKTAGRLARRPRAASALYMFISTWAPAGSCSSTGARTWTSSARCP